MPLSTHSVVVSVALLCLAAQVLGQQDDCSAFTRCNDCITRTTSCAWCNDIDAFQAYVASSSDLNPAPFCATEDDLQNLYNCQTIINPRTENTTEEAVGPSQVQFDSAQLTLRAGDSAIVEFTVSPADEVPVDMYLLMDLTSTMRQNLEQIRRLSDRLVAAMRERTSDLRIAFGSFVDKPLSPFSDALNLDFPCLADAASGVNQSTCEAVYTFRHRLDFTDDTDQLQSQLNNAVLSASRDAPEAMMDALMQVALCEDELGWRPRGQSRRLIVVISDGDYHYALDGKLAGLTQLPAKQCALDPVTMEYTASTLHDYPSSAAIAEVLNERTMIPIFVVTSVVTPVYATLARIIRSAFVETLAPNDESILEAITNQYDVLSSTVVPVVSGLEQIPVDMLNVTVLPTDNCSPGRLQENSTDVCADISYPSSVSYTLAVTASRDICTANLSSIMARVQFIGFGDMEVTISFHCSGCSCDPPVADSPQCTNAGTLECSTCLCNEGFEGTQCNCPVVEGVAGPIGCAASSLVADCSGRGQCECGVCRCDRISADSELVYQGQFCQHNPIDCPTARGNSGQFLPCAGRGTCVDSRCDCTDNFSGAACECNMDVSTCLAPGASSGEGEGEEGDELCSGEGDCLCGICVCRNYSLNIGRYCEECVPCLTSCLRLNPCVRCAVLGEGGEDDVDCSECDGRLALVNSTAAITGSDFFKTCSMVENFCEIRYQVGTNVMGDEDSISIAIDQNQRTISILGEAGRCNQSTPIWAVFVGIILGIIAIGLLVVCLWRSCTYLAEWLEYRQWEKSVTEDTDRATNNPIFLDPNTKYSNPRYRPGSNVE